MIRKSYDPTVDGHFGICPECAAGGDFHEGNWLNYGREQWAACHAHELRWFLGENVISSWREESEEVWARNRAVLERYEEVESGRVEEYPDLLAQREWLHETLNSLAEPGFPQEEVPF